MRKRQFLVGSFFVVLLSHTVVQGSVYCGDLKTAFSTIVLQQLAELFPQREENQFYRRYPKLAEERATGLVDRLSPLEREELLKSTSEDTWLFENQISRVEEVELKAYLKSVRREREWIHFTLLQANGEKFRERLSEAKNVKDVVDLLDEHYLQVRKYYPKARGNYSAITVIELARVIQREIGPMLQKIPKGAVYFFGSFPNGKANRTESDIDLVVNESVSNFLVRTSVGKQMRGELERVLNNAILNYLGKTGGVQFIVESENLLDFTSHYNPITVKIEKTQISLIYWDLRLLSFRQIAYPFSFDDGN